MSNWRKSSYTGSGNDEACVEVAPLADHVGVRDSKHPHGGRLELRRAAFGDLLARVKRGDISR